MKRLYTILLVLPSFLSIHLTATAQTNNNPASNFYVGKSENLLKDMGMQSDNARSADLALVNLRVSSSKAFKGKINFRETTGGDQSIAGSLQDVSDASFFIIIKDKAVEGNIILRHTKQAYKYSSDEQGNTYVTEVDIDKVLCIDYLKKVQTTSETQNRSSGAVAQIGAAVLNLQSYPQGIACVYLDLDGHFYQGSWWADGDPINALPTTLSDAQILEAWELTSEDFSPFSINVTTSETVFNSYPVNKRQRCVVTPTTDAAPGAGGVAYVDLFNGDVPCWVFTSTGKSAGEAISHEIGHTLGLSHDGRTTPSEGYYLGQGSWAPIMGVGYYKTIVQWSKGEYASANNTQDDLTIIVRPTRATGAKPDEHGNTIATATPLQIDALGNVSASLNFGIIGTTSDVDMFTFSTAGGNTVLNFNPAARHGNLDILATLYNSSGGVVTTSDPTGLAAVISATLTSGVYYISIEGTGAGDPVTNGYSDYASLGFFTISGTVIPTPSTNQSPVVSITAPASGATFITPATIAITANASDPDGSISRVEFFYGTTKIGEDLTSPFSFSWASVPAGSYSITAKATDNQGKQVVSTGVSVQVNVNLAPSVSITSPLQNAIFTPSPATIAITANASDADGSVSKVEFFNGTTKLGEDVTSPFSFSWTSVPAGFYSITAKATDNQGGQTTSSAVSVQVKVNLAPSISITSPLQNAIFSPSPATIAIAANASDSDGSISKVEFFNGTTKLGEDLTSPFSFSWTSVTVGTYSIKAKATDNLGSQTTSTAVSVQVKANLVPTISIISPNQNDLFTAPATIEISATASDADGSISKVEFFNGTIKLGESLSSPYNFSWKNVPFGNYTIVAKATDNLGATASADVKAIVDENPNANAGADYTLALPLNSLSLTGSGSTVDGSKVTFSWAQLSGPNNALFSSIHINSPDVSSLIIGVYVFELTVMNSNGLTSKDQVTITVELPLDIAMGAIPRFFSPNGDGNNDLWEWPNIELYINSKLTVFNQSGQEIYLAESYNNTWDGKTDGKPLAENAYYYIIQLSNNKKITGAVRIIR